MNQERIPGVFLFGTMGRNLENEMEYALKSIADDFDIFIFRGYIKDYETAQLVK